MYAFMQAVGMVNDHERPCFRFRELQDKTSAFAAAVLLLPCAAAVAWTSTTSRSAAGGRRQAAVPERALQGARMEEQGRRPALRRLARRASAASRSQVTFYLKKDAVEAFDVRFDTRELDRLVGSSRRATARRSRSRSDRLRAQRKERAPGVQGALGEAARTARCSLPSSRSAAPRCWCRAATSRKKSTACGQAHPSSRGLLDFSFFSAAIARAWSSALSSAMKLTNFLPMAIADMPRKLTPASPSAAGDLRAQAGLVAALDAHRVDVLRPAHARLLRRLDRLLALHRGHEHHALAGLLRGAAGEQHFQVRACAGEVFELLRGASGAVVDGDRPDFGLADFSAMISSSGLGQAA